VTELGAGRAAAKAEITTFGDALWQAMSAAATAGMETITRSPLPGAALR
jgi:hypothetical protein